MIFRLIGLIQWAEALESIYKKKKIAQEDANVPLSQAEEAANWHRNRV